MPAALVAVAVVDSAGAPLTTAGFAVASPFTKPLRLYVTPRLGVNDGSGRPYALVRLLAVTLRTAGKMVNDWVTETALYDGRAPGADAGAEAVILHTPTPEMVPLVEHGPEDVKLTAAPEEDVALNEKVLPYCTFGKVAKLIVCDVKLEPCGRIVNIPDTALAAL